MKGHWTIEAIHDDWEGFRVLVTPDSTIVERPVRISFDPIAYRNSDERNRTRTWMSEGYKGTGSFWVISNSEFIAQLVRDSSEVLDAADLTHFAIFTTTDCLDVVVEFAPTAERL
jgi:hypothetical protein